MANWDFVIPYDPSAADWLADQGFPHPPAQSGNRLPTRAEFDEAVDSLGLTYDDLLVADFAADGESLKLRGDKRLELCLLRRLAESCGQLWLYPDSGLPAILVEASSDPESLAAAWLASGDAEDSWRAFHRGSPSS